MNQWRNYPEKDACLRGIFRGLFGSTAPTQAASGSENLRWFSRGRDGFHGLCPIIEAYCGVGGILIGVVESRLAPGRSRNLPVNYGCARQSGYLWCVLPLVQKVIASVS